MLLLAASLGLLSLVGYTVYYKPRTTTSKSLTEKLNARIDNGERFRDITYTNTIDIAHPDVKNNSFYFGGSFASDRGDNGIPRQYCQLYPGSSEITQVALMEHLYL